MFKTWQELVGLSNQRKKRTKQGADHAARTVKPLETNCESLERQRLKKRASGSGPLYFVNFVSKKRGQKKKPLLLWLPTEQPAAIFLSGLFLALGSS